MSTHGSWNFTRPGIDERMSLLAHVNIVGRCALAQTVGGRLTESVGEFLTRGDARSVLQQIYQESVGAGWCLSSSTGIGVTLPIFDDRARRKMVIYRELTRAGHAGRLQLSLFKYESRTTPTYQVQHVFSGGRLGPPAGFDDQAAFFDTSIRAQSWLEERARAMRMSSWLPVAKPSYGQLCLAA